MKQPEKYQICLISLVIIGAVLRFYHLGFNSIWLDEALTYHFSQLSFNEYWQIFQSATDFHPPLFYDIEKIGLLFGASEINLRIIPTIFGIATIPVFYLIGKKLLGRPIGLIMAGLITFSPFHIAYSQDARMYTLLLFFVSLALLFYFYSIESNSQKQWILFGIVSAISLWVHFYAFIFLMILYFTGFVTYLWDRTEFKNIGYSFIFFFIISIPVLSIAPTILHARVTGTSPTWGVIGMDYISDLLITFFSNYPEGIVVLVLLFTLGMINIILMKKRLFFIITTILSLNILIAIILSFIIPMVGRYLIILLPLIYIGIASTYFSFDLKDTRYVGIVIILLFLVMSIPQLGFYYTTATKDNWRDATSDLQFWLNHNYTIVVVPAYNQIPFEYYYNNTSNNNVRYLSSLDALTKIHDNYSEVNRNSHYYIVISQFDLKAVDPNNSIISWLGKHGMIQGEYKGIQIWNITPDFKMAGA
jgi:mannosyltransferase